MAKGTGKAYYMISVVAQRYNIHPQTLRLYEREGLLKPSRTDGNTRLYSDEDLERLETILSLTRDLGVNLAGVEIILNMRGRIEQMQGEVNEFMQYVKREMVQGPRRLGAAAQHRDGQVDARRPRPRRAALARSGHASPDRRRRAADRRPQDRSRSLATRGGPGVAHRRPKGK